MAVLQNNVHMTRALLSRICELDVACTSQTIRQMPVPLVRTSNVLQNCLAMKWDPFFWPVMIIPLWGVKIGNQMIGLYYSD